MSKWKWLKWRIRLTDRDFWFDSFGKFFNKWFRCFLLGHGKVRFLEDGGCNGETRYKCFHCMMSIDPQYDKVRKYMEP
jgi:hypothetical protein